MSRSLNSFYSSLIEMNRSQFERLDSRAFQILFLDQIQIDDKETMREVMESDGGTKLLDILDKINRSDKIKSGRTLNLGLSPENIVSVSSQVISATENLGQRILNVIENYYYYSPYNFNSSELATHVQNEIYYFQNESWWQMGMQMSDVNLVLTSAELFFQSAYSDFELARIASGYSSGDPNTIPRINGFWNGLKNVLISVVMHAIVGGIIGGVIGAIATAAAGGVGAALGATFGAGIGAVIGVFMAIDNKCIETNQLYNISYVPCW